MSSLLDTYNRQLYMTTHPVAPELARYAEPLAEQPLSRRRACQAMLLGMFGAGGCATEPAAPPPLVLAVPPRLWTGESATLATRLRGRVVVNRNNANGGLAVMNLAQPGAGVVAMGVSARGAAGELLPIWGVSPPDRQGAVVVLTPGRGDRTNALRYLAPGQPARVLRESPGDPLWDRPVSPLALSDNGRRLAFVAQEDPRVQHRPLHRGILHVLEVATPGSPPATALELNPSWSSVRAALGQRPAWLPGGTRLVYAAAGPRGRALTQAPEPERQPDPELRLLDLERGTDERLASGHRPIVSTDGSSVLFARGPASQLVVLHLSTGTETTLAPRRGLSRPVAWLEGRYLIEIGMPHPEAPRGQTTNNSPVVGPKTMLALKVLDVQTGEALTLLEGVDPRLDITAA